MSTWAAETNARFSEAVARGRSAQKRAGKGGTWEDIYPAPRGFALRATDGLDPSKTYSWAHLGLPDPRHEWAGWKVRDLYGTVREVELIWDDPYPCLRWSGPNVPGRVGDGPEGAVDDGWWIAGR